MADQATVVTTLRSDDVLFGRGSGPNDHEGNIKFRELVGARKEEYMATNHRQTKAKIARSIVDQVLQRNGRFLKKLDASEGAKHGVPEGVDGYIVVDDDTVMEKAKQALRQNRERQQKDDSSKASGTKSLSPHRQRLPQQMNMPSNLPNNIPSNMQNMMYGASGVGVEGAAFNHVNVNDLQPHPLPAFNNAGPTQVNPNMNVGGYGEPFIAHQPMANGSNNNNQSLYDQEAETYQTYVTELSDPDHPQMKPPTPNSNRRSSFQRSADLGIGFSGGSRRGNMVGGRRDNSMRGMNAMGKQDSMQFGEVWRRESLVSGQAQSMQMSELMDSFTKMSTTGSGGEMSASTDTIGTIEPIAGAGTSNMSILSNMSAFSMTSNMSLGIFKSESSDDGGRGTNRSRSGSSDNGILDESSPSSGKPPSRNPATAKQEKRVSSLSNSELWSSKNVQGLMQGPLGESGMASSRAAMMESTGTFGSMFGSMAMLPEEDLGTADAAEIFGAGRKEDDDGDDSKQILPPRKP